MAKRFFFTLVLGILLSVSNFNHSYGQGCYDLRLGRYVSVSPFNQERIKYLKYNFDRLTIEYCQRDSFYKRNGDNDKLYLTSEVDFPVILNGDTTRIKWIFDNSVITHIEVEGVGKTTPEDVKKGQFVITVTPEETTLYKARIHIKHVDGTISVHQKIADRRVIVVYDRKTQAKIMENAELHRINQEIKRLSQYMDSWAGGVREGKWLYFPDKLNTYIENVSGRDRERIDMQLANENIDVPDTKTLLKEETERFNNYTRLPDKWLNTSLEHAVIARGDSTRIKFVFDSRKVRGIQVLGYGRASRDDIRKGEYIVTVNPKKTKLIECWVNTRVRIPAHYRVIVVKPEEYDEVMKKIYKLRKLGWDCNHYLNELAGEVTEM